MNGLLIVKQLQEILKDMPPNAVIYLGDDEELNGIHGAYYCQRFSKSEVIDSSNGGYNKPGVLIS